MELCLHKTECYVQEDVCSVGLSQEGRQEGVGSWTARLVSQVIHQRNGILLPLGSFGVGNRETKSVSVSKICP